MQELAIPRHQRRSLVRRLARSMLAVGLIGGLGSGALAVITAGPSGASTTTFYYAAPTASGTGDCSSVVDPCTLPTAITTAENTTGDVQITLASGDYPQVTIAPQSGSPMASLAIVGPNATPPTAVFKPTSLSLNVTPGGNGHFFDEDGAASGDPNTGAIIGSRPVRSTRP